MNGWGVTAADVFDDTGATVLDIDIHRAANTVDIYTNRTQAASGSIAPRDMVWIKRAVVSQVAWLISQPGYFGRSVTAKRDQDGLAIDHGSQGSGWREWADTLAPLAARAIKNLSWKGTRKEHDSRRARRVPDSLKFLDEDDTWDGILP